MNRKILSVICVIAIVFSSFTNLYAVEDQFEISATVTGDASAPSTPSGLTATAVSSSQIDLSWSASTDNVAVTGYKIYRDNVYITTVGVTSYSDTGLSADTTYSYKVSAIDAASNESAQSSSASATTFSVPVVSSGGGTVQTGQHQNAVIYDVAVNPTNTGATITWKTTQPAVGTLSWGLTSNYELGLSAGYVYTTSHSVKLNGLLPGTSYLYKIEVVNGYGIKTVLGGLELKTLPMAEGLENPLNFTATPSDSSITLDWQNPIFAKFEEVRIVRSEKFFPNDPNDGKIIYEGTDERYVDFDVKAGVTYYYTIFSKDSDGKFSSGSVAKARIKIPGEPEVPEKDIFDELPKAPEVHPVIEALEFIDFDFIQDGKKIAGFQEGSSVVIDGSKNLTVHLDYEKVPEVLKSIIVILTHPAEKNKTFSFLLRVNDDKTAYTATIGPLGDSGKYSVKIAIVDYKNQGLKSITGNLLAVAKAEIDSDLGSFFIALQIINENKINLLLLLVLIIIFFKAIRMAIDRKKRKKGFELVNPDASTN